MQEQNHPYDPSVSASLQNPTLAAATTTTQGANPNSNHDNDDNNNGGNNHVNYNNLNYGLNNNSGGGSGSSSANNSAMHNAMMMMQYGQMYPQQHYHTGDDGNGELTADGQQVMGSGIADRMHGSGENGGNGSNGSGSNDGGEEEEGDEESKQLQLQQQQQILQQIQQQQQQQQQQMAFMGAFNPYLYYPQYQGAMQAPNSSSNPSPVANAAGANATNTTTDQNNAAQAYLSASGRMNAMSMAQSSYPFLAFGYPGFTGMNVATPGMAAMMGGTGNDSRKRKDSSDDSDEDEDDSSDDEDADDSSKKKAKRGRGIKTFYCEKCKREYRSESIYQKHCMFSKMHDPNNVKNWPLCAECGQRYYPTNQEQHLQQCRKRRALGMPATPPKPETPIKHFCKKCDKGFRSKSGFDQHVKFDLAHDSENINNWQYCKRCNKRLPPTRMYYHNKVCQQHQEQQRQQQDVQDHYAMQLPMFAGNPPGAAILSSVAGKDATEMSGSDSVLKNHDDGQRDENESSAPLDSSIDASGSDDLAKVEHVLSMMEEQSTHSSGAQENEANI